MNFNKYLSNLIEDSISASKKKITVTSSGTRNPYKDYMVSEDCSYFMKQTIELLMEDRDLLYPFMDNTDAVNEDVSGFLATLSAAGKAAWNAFNTAVGGQIGKLGDKVTELGNWLGTQIKNHTNITAAGLAGAGLLGTYYLYKKFKDKKKIDPSDQAMAQKLDKMDASKVASMNV